MSLSRFAFAASLAAVVVARPAAQPPAQDAAARARAAHVFVYTAMMEGRSADALGRARELAQVFPPELMKQNAVSADAFQLAIARLTEAVKLEDALKYDEPPPWTVPSRHALGAVLISGQRFAEAEAVFRADLARYPENGWALRGLADALEGQGKAAEATSVKECHRAAWARADVELECSCACACLRPREP